MAGSTRSRECTVVCRCVCERERDRGRERQRETERKRSLERAREKGRETGTAKERPRERKREGEREKPDLREFVSCVFNTSLSNRILQPHRRFVLAFIFVFTCVVVYV